MNRGQLGDKAKDWDEVNLFMGPPQLIHDILEMKKKAKKKAGKKRSKAR